MSIRGDGVKERPAPDLHGPSRQGPGRALRALRTTPVTIALSVLIMSLTSFLAVFGPILQPHADVVHPTVGLLGSTAEHPLGTDNLGRDVFALVIAGARTSIGGPALIAVATLMIASVLALVAAYWGGRVDALLSRAVDFIYSLPHLIVAIVVVGITGGGYTMALVVLTVLNIPQCYRVIRGPALSQRVLPYFEACYILGYSARRIVTRHLFPNVLPFVVSALFLRFMFAIVELAALSFLGLGVPPGTADWGRMLDENREFLGINPWATIAPGIALVLTGAGANILGDWIIESAESRGKSR